jgi:hypothetical protein
VRTEDDGESWLAVDVPGDPTSICVDRAGRRLLVSYPVGRHWTGWGYEAPGFQCLDLETLADTGFQLEPVLGDEELRQKQGRDYREGRYYPWPKTAGAIFADVGGDGSIYVVDGQRDIKWHKYWSSVERGPENWPGVVRRYAPDGSIAEEAVCRLFHPGGSGAIGSDGSIYVTDLCGANGFFIHGPLYYGYRKRAAEVSPEAAQKYPHQYLYDPQSTIDPWGLKRGQDVVRRQSEIAYLLKFGPEGGVRCSEDELWAHPGISPHTGGGCYCDWQANTLAVDGADRLIVADDDHKRVKVIDTTGNLIATFGCFGNAQTVPIAGDARDLGFRLIYCIDAVGDTCYVGDKDLRRIARVRMAYRETQEVVLP